MTTKTVSKDDAAEKFTELLAFTLEGNEVIIVENEKQIARLVPVSFSNLPRIAGLNKNKIWSSDDFDSPLPDDFWLGKK